MKKLFSLFSMLMLLSNNALPAFTYAEEIDDNAIINLFSDLLNTYGVETSCEVGTEYTSGDYKGITTENCGIKITEYNGTATDIVIPNEINGYIVREIGENVFKQKGITSVVMPDSVEIIGTGAFQESHFSENFTLEMPASLKRIESYSFEESYLSGLKEFPKNLEYIGDYAFSNFRYRYDGCYNTFRKVIIPNSVKYIGQYAFNGIPIEELRIGNSVEYIGNYAFQDSHSYNHQECSTTFDELEIPDSVNFIGYGAFQSNKKLKKVSIGNGNGSIKLIGGEFNSCSIADFSINKDTIIMGYDNSGNDNDNASYNPLEKINISVNHVIIEGKHKLLDSAGNRNTYKYADLVLSGNAFSGLITYNWRGPYLHLNSITFPESTTGFKNEMYENMGIINYISGTLIIPGNIKTIGYNTFHGNNYIKNLIIEEGVEKIDNEAFYLSNNIENIEFSSTIKSIGNKAFAYLNKAEDLTIPGNIKKIGNSAFESAIILKNLNLGEGIEEIGERAFWAINREINGIYIPDSIKTIGLNAFCKDVWDSVNKVYIIDDSSITGYVTKDVPQEWIDNETCMNFIRRYKVEFTGDSNHITIPERQVLDQSGMATEPIVGDIEGYQFNGWYKLGESEPYDFSTEVNENIILEARLSKNRYNVTYTNVEGVENTSVLFNEDIPLPTPKNRTGFNFNGRKGIPESGKMPARDIILIGQWSTIQPSAGGGQAITPTKQETKVTEQEHNSADTENQKTTNTQTNTQTSNVTTSEDIKKQVKIVEDRSLTRGEVAIMTNILLEVYPQLVEGRAELDDITNACSNYADEQNFTKDEKKAITRLCKLSIMGIHNDTNKPLEEFLVNSKSTNDEFSKVINRSIETYNEKDLSTIKDALKKLEGDEENVVFGTVYDVFMSIKSIFN